MKKRILLIALTVLLLSLLAACGCDHNWEDATCEEPKTCSECGETEGKELGHEWKDATCEAPKTCSVCGETEGEAGGHTWVEADCMTPKTCSVCGETEGEALGHQADWAPSTTDFEKMVGTCQLCGNEVEEAVDWEAAAPSFIIGQWEAAMMQYNGSMYDMESGYTVVIREDGTATFDNGGTIFEMTWEFNQAVRYSESYEIEVIGFLFTDEGGNQYTMAVTYIFGNEVTSIYMYLSDSVIVYRTQ